MAVDAAYLELCLGHMNLDTPVILAGGARQQHHIDHQKCELVSLRGEILLSCNLEYFKPRVNKVSK